MKRRKKDGAPASAKEAEFDQALEAVIADYMEFLRRSREADESNGDPKPFAARHSAGKTALSHIEQIMKLKGDHGDEAAKKLNEYQALLGDMRRDMNAEAGEMASDDDAEPG